VQANENGEYSVSYIPQVPGIYVVKVSVNGTPIGGGLFSVAVKGKDASALAEGIVNNMKQFEPSFFSLNPTSATKKLEERDFEVDFDGPGEVPYHFIKDGDKLRVEYLPRIPGVYKMYVKQNGIFVKGSPFNFEVLSGVDPDKSCLADLDLEPSRGERTQFSIKARDFNNKPYISLKDWDGTNRTPKEFDVEIDGPDNIKVPNRILPNGDGTYTVSYVPRKTGKYNINVKLNGQPIQGNSFEVEAKSADPLQTTVDGPGVEDGLRANEPTHFLIHSKDKQGGIRRYPDPFNVDVTPARNVSDIKLTPVGNGDIRVDYVPIKPGRLGIRVSIDGQDVKSSPFDITIDPKADPSLCQVDGPKLMKDGHPSNFKVTVRDQDGKNLPYDPHRILVDVDGPENPHVVVQDNRDGTYNVELDPHKPGKYKVAVKVDGADVKGSPYNVDVKDSADPFNSIVDGPRGVDFNKNPEINLLITAKDKDGKQMKSGGDDFECLIDGCDKPKGFKDNQNGTYNVLVVPRKPGKHVVTVTLDGRNITNSPFDLAVTTGPDNGFTTAEGSGTKKAYHGLPAIFRIVPRDKEGIECYLPALEFDVEVFNVNLEPVKSAILVDDDGMGRYMCIYTPDSVGMHKVEVKFGGEHIKNSPFNVSCKDKEKAPDALQADVQVPSKMFTNQPNTCKVVLKDANGKDLAVGGDDVDVSIDDPGDVDTKVKDLKNGNYKVTVIPRTTGKHLVAVKVNGKPVKNSPFKTDVLKSTKPSAKASTVVDCAVTITAPNRKPEDFDIRFENARAKLVTNLRKGKNNFHLPLTSSERDEHTIEIKLKNSHIKGSPFTHTF